MESGRFDLFAREVAARPAGRRALLGVLAGGGLAGLFGREVAEAKRCPNGRTPCAGRCCPKGRRCENGACVGACADPFVCGSGGGSCGGRNDCFCATDVVGAAACVRFAPSTLCADFPACGAGIACPKGLVCVSCTCDVDNLDFRCAPPCPAR